MAEAIGLAASLVGIASAGVSVVSTLTKFGISLRGSNDKINSLAGRVSLTASILSDIATTVEQNASGFKKEEFWRTWRKVLSSCEDSYGKLETALLKARRSGNSKEKGGKDGVSVWGKLVWALGGETEMQDLETSLERCCQQVMMMQQAVQMSVLSLIAQRQKLSSDEIEDQRELMSKLQWLLSTLSEAGVLPTGNATGKVIVIDPQNTDPPKALPRDPPRSRPRDPPSGLDVADNEQPSTLDRGFGPGGPGRSKDSPRIIGFADNEVPPTLDKGFGPGGPGAPRIGFGSFIAHTVLPQPKPKPSKEKPKSTSWQPPEQEKEEQSEQKEYFFEAYYIIPRSVPRNQPRGQIQLTKPVPDDYMIICLDTKQDYRKDPNLRNALRRAKRARTSASASTVDDFPKSVREAALSLASHRKRHGNGLTWSLVEGVQLRCQEDSAFRKSSSKSGFLIVFRGSISQINVRGMMTRGQPPPQSILKGSTNKEYSRPISHSAQPHYIPDIPSAVPAAPAFDPVAAAYQAGKTDSDAERFDLDQYPRTIVSYRRENGKGSAEEPVESQGLTPERGFSISRNSSVIEAANFQRPPNSPEPEKAAFNIRPGSLTSSPENNKKKAKVGFENAELMKNERHVSRPLPGPVLYDPARSKLLPETPRIQSLPGYDYSKRNYQHPSVSAGQSMQAHGLQRPQAFYSASGPPPAPQSPPASYTYASTLTNQTNSYGSYLPPPPPPGWTASSHPSRPPGAPIVVPVSGDSERPNRPPIKIDSATPHPPTSRRRQSDSSSGILSWMSGKPSKRQYVEHDRHGRERIVLSSRRQSTAVPRPKMYHDSGSKSGSDSESDSESESERRRSRKGERVSAEDVFEIAIEQKKRRSRDETRRRMYRRDSAVNPELGIVSYGTEPGYTQQVTWDGREDRRRERHKERLEEDLRKVGAAPEVIASRLQEVPDSRGSRRETVAAGLSIAGAALSLNAVKKLRDNEEEARRKAKMQAEQDARMSQAQGGVSTASAAIETAADRKNGSDEEQERRRRRTAQSPAATNDELRIRPAGLHRSTSYTVAQSGTRRPRPTVTYYNDDRDWDRREERPRLLERETQDMTREKEDREVLRERERRQRSPGTYSPARAPVFFHAVPLSRREIVPRPTPSHPVPITTTYKVTADPATVASRRGPMRERSRTRRSTIDSNARPIVVTSGASETEGERRRRVEELGLGDQRYERHGSRATDSRSPAGVEDSEPTISDFSSESEDEDSTLVEDKGDGEELHLSQQEAQAMMMNFLATFTAV